MSDLYLHCMTVLPSTWLAYPGTNVDGATFQGDGLTGDDCFDLCLADATCVAVDFNSGDGSCWFHTTVSQCDILNAMNAVYHAQKPPQCSEQNFPYETFAMAVLLRLIFDFGFHSSTY